jgi:hypothetical protein
VVLDSHGEVAARVCSILDTQGHLEADAIAETAMVPAKDTREVRRVVLCMHSYSSRADSHFDATIDTFQFIDPSPVVPCQLHYSVHIAAKQTAQSGEYDILVDSGQDKNATNCHRQCLSSSDQLATPTTA